MWPFDTLIDWSPAYNLALGIGIMIAGIFAFRLIPGKFISGVIGVGMLAAGLAIATGYWVIL